MIFFAANLLLVIGLYILLNDIDIKQRITGIREIVKTPPKKKTLPVICFSVFIVSVLVFNLMLKNIPASIALSIIPSFCLYGANDLFNGFKADKEAGQITYFLMTMAKWSAVRNDMVFCLRKTVEAGMEKPIGTLTEKTLGRIQGGMDIGKAFSLLERESHSEDLRYLSRSIGFASEKGGNLQNLFTGMEKQYFRIDEEIFRRKISTVRDRSAVYITVLSVIVTAFWFLLKNPTAGEFYLETALGNYIMIAFSVVFAGALLFMVRR